MLVHILYTLTNARNLVYSIGFQALWITSCLEHYLFWVLLLRYTDHECTISMKSMVVHPSLPCLQKYYVYCQRWMQNFWLKPSFWSKIFVIKIIISPHPPSSPPPTFLPISFLNSEDTFFFFFLIFTKRVSK